MEAYLGWISVALKDIETAIRIAALFIAGAWAYMKFVKGRVYYPRLELDVSGDAHVRDDHATLAVSIKVKNVGLSRVDIRQSGTGLRISAAEERSPKIMIAAEWRHLGTFPILESHAWIEPGEPVGEDRLIILPKGLSRNLLLQMNVASAKSAWEATRIIVSKPGAEVRGTVALDEPSDEEGRYDK
jgi:hypothetical protein